MPEFQGHLLIASPTLRDPNFARSVVLLIRHNEDGAFGLILNRPTKVPLAQVWSQASESPCNSKERLHLGGPVEGPLMALHTQPSLSDLEILDGVYFSTEPDHLRTLVAQRESTTRFFAGYSGWGNLQLENEMAEGSWLTLPATAGHMFHNEKDLWDKVRREIADASLLVSLKIKQAPPDPRLN